MNLHEYQAKRLFKEYGLPVASGVVISDAGEAESAIAAIPGDSWVVKVQVHTGGRGKAGGVKLVANAAEVEDFAKQWLGKRMVTYQSGEAGLPVDKLLLEPCTDIASELYLAAVVDRDSKSIVVMASAEGGVDIEQVAAKDPDAVLHQSVDIVSGPQPWQGRELGYRLGLTSAQGAQLGGIVTKLVKLMQDKDLSLVEINPLVVTAAGDLFCLDAKINVDDNALFRHKDIAEMRDTAQEDEREAHAAQWDLNYVALQGNIGCMVNGAGLAMATMDMIQVNGGSPANFLDVGGNATSERVAEALKIILSDTNVRVILVNIFGGIVRCDLIAEGMISAIAEVGVDIPVVVRLQGNNAPIGLEILSKAQGDIHTEENLQQAAELCVRLATEQDQ